MNIFLFGDSITYGAWDREGGWASRLRKFVDLKILSSETDDYYHLVYNLGISGERTDYLLERFEGELRARTRREKDCAVVFAIGANDSQYSNAEKTFNTSPEQFEKNIVELIRMARGATSRIAFVGLLPGDDAKMDPIPWRPERTYKNEYISRYNGIVKKVCSEQGTIFIDVFDDFLGQDHTSLLEDGIHPNNEGHRMIFERVRDALVSQGWI